MTASFWIQYCQVVLPACSYNPIVPRKTKKGKGRGNNPRLKNTREDIKDEDLKRELKSGNILIILYADSINK